MTENYESEMMFVELCSSNFSPGSSHSFIAKLSHPITLHTKSRVGIQNIRTEGFCNIFGENLSIEIEKSLNGVIERSTVVLQQGNFKSVKIFIHCLNEVFDEHNIHFSEKDGFISIKNKNDDYQIKLIPTKALMLMIGCDVSRHFYPIMLKPSRVHTLPNKFDMCILFPKCLSFALSFNCTQASETNQKDTQQHIVFLTDGENPNLFELEEKYCHRPGIFNYVKITITNIFDDSFLLCSNIIHASLSSNKVN